MAPGRALMAGGALLSSAPGRVQPLPAFMLVVPPSLRADEVSLRGACGWGEGTGKGRMVADDRMWERDPPPAGPEGVGIPLGLESTRVLPSFWVGIRNPTWAVSSCMPPGVPVCPPDLCVRCWAGEAVVVASEF